MVTTIAMKGKHHIGSPSSTCVSTSTYVGINKRLADHIAGLRSGTNVERITWLINLSKPNTFTVIALPWLSRFRISCPIPQNSGSGMIPIRP